MKLEENEDANFQNPQDDQNEFAEIVHPDKIEQQNKLTCTVDLPKDKVMLDMKINIEKKASGTVLQEDVKEKRNKEELMEFVSDQSDLNFLYKVI